MQLELLGHSVDVAVEELDAVRSPHTGRDLRRVAISLRVDERNSDGVSSAFGDARAADHALTDSDGSKWVVETNSYSYQDGSLVHNHSAELREAEEFDVEALEFLGVAIQPSYYNEELDGDAIAATGLVELEGEADTALEEAITSDRDDDYFDVVRRGLADEPIRMRLGRCFWQRTPTGRSHLITLISEAGDTDDIRRGPNLFRPELGHLARKAVATAAALEELLAQLEAAGVLPEAAITAIRDRAATSWDGRDHRAWDEVDDITDYL